MAALAACWFQFTSMWLTANLAAALKPEPYSDDMLDKSGAGERHGPGVLGGGDRVLRPAVRGFGCGLGFGFGVTVSVTVSAGFSAFSVVVSGSAFSVVLSAAGVAALPFSSGVSAQLAAAIPSTNVAAIAATIFFLRLATILSNVSP